MSQRDHVREPGYLAAWRALGLQQTLGPDIGPWRRRCLPLRRLWQRASAAVSDLRGRSNRFERRQEAATGV